MGVYGCDTIDLINYSSVFITNDIVWMVERNIKHIIALFEETLSSWFASLKIKPLKELGSDNPIIGEI